MKKDEINNSRKLSVESVRFVHGRGPVFYASLPIPRAPSAGQSRPMQGTAEEKQYLISSLWDHLMALSQPFGWLQPFGGGHAGNDSARLPIQVIKGLLGRPHLLVDGRPGPAISFCLGEGNIFAALCADGSDIGIDAAHPREFQGNYPLNRVFHPKELDHALTMVNGKIEAAAALLWSVKEAVVKALGCAFHLMGPCQMMVYPSRRKDSDKGQEHDFCVGVSKNATMRFPMAGHMTGGRSVWVRSFFHKKMWFSIALLNRQPRYADRAGRFIPQRSKRIR
jgi:phosphopantetheinyl transferase (holo-ACP synthase)